MPALTVAMPAYNAAPYIRQAIESVLRQTEVDIELIVVDDASHDGTADVVAQFTDARVRLLRHGTRRGIGACHNLVLRESRAAYIAHVDADDFILPGALAKMLAAVGTEPGVGQVHCYFFDLDADGQTTRDAFAARWRRFHRSRAPRLDYRAALSQSAGIANGLRTYPKTVLTELGGFNEQLRFAVDYDMSLRVADRYRIVLVPEFLYARRVHATQTTQLWLQPFRFWLQKYRVRRRLVRDRKIRFLPRAPLHFVSFVRHWRHDLWEPWRQWIHTSWRRAVTALRWRGLGVPAARLSRAAAQYLHWWPLRWWPAAPIVPHRGRLAYYIRRFPVLSETFIQREIGALQRAGMRPLLMALATSSQHSFPSAVERLRGETLYLEPLDRERLQQYVRRFRRRHPLILLNLYLYIAWHRRARHQSPRFDRLTWERALYVAGVLEDHGVGHVHSAWADDSMFAVILAARLVGIGYSLQARAFDIYRHAPVFALRDKLAAARFVITNARYNLAALQPLLAGATAPRVHVVYEGLVPAEFQPPTRAIAADTPLAILAVGRLVEQKGFDDLLRACRLLQERGIAFHCTIIGGKIASQMNHALQLRKLHRALALSDHVAFLGAQPQSVVIDHYRRADVLVLPAVLASAGGRDVTPNVILEAMAMQLPVISTAIGGIPELVEDGVTGLLVPPRDPTAVATALGQLARDPALRQRLGASGRRTVEARFDIDANIATYVRLFEECVMRDPRNSKA